MQDNQQYFFKDFSEFLKARQFFIFKFFLCFDENRVF